MRVCILILSASLGLFGADEQRLALALKAQSQFDRVNLAATPDLRDATACIQTQAALLAVATPEETPLVHYHKGFCTLAGAVLTHSSKEFGEAAAEFDKAIEGWPARASFGGKKIPPEPPPSNLHILASVARLESETNDAGLDRAHQEILTAVDVPTCPSSLMPPASCAAVVEIGHEWLGWIALRRDNLMEATREFSTSQGDGWKEWTAGRQAFAYREYKEAASHYRQALDLFQRIHTPTLADGIRPVPDLPLDMTELGGAQLLAGDTTQAIATFDAAVKTDPSDARALYLRARAKDEAGQSESALNDYNLASRTAFANAKDLASGEAHLYRGILLYRRKDFTHAEDEFSSALNFEIPTGLRADAVAWRHLSALASGACSSTRQYLERSLATVTPYFPKDEARSLLAACPTTTAGLDAPSSGK